MERQIQEHFIKWRNNPKRKPLLLKGARQVGKSYVIKKCLKPLTSNFVEVNFEKHPEISNCFKQNLDPKEILKKLELQLKTQILNRESILFLDEVQVCPEAIASLRYFYEDRLELPVICAGSLIEFALEKIPVPVGRLEYAYLRPLSFEEFLLNSKNQNLLNAIKEEFPGPFSPTVHRLGLDAVRDYASLGGMPEVLANFIEGNGILSSLKIQKNLLETYHDDLPKYALKAREYQNIADVFKKVPYLTCKPFKFVDISREQSSAQIKHSLTLLQKAQLISPITNASGIPPSQFASLSREKLLFLDIGLMQHAIRFESSKWLDESEALLNNGSIAEQFVGQELLALNTPDKLELFYWERMERNSSAEIDYLLQIASAVLPLEVKSVAAGRLNSLKLFLEKYKEVPFGVRFCGLNSQHHKKLLSLPHYALPEFFYQLKTLGLKEFAKKMSKHLV